MTRAVVFDSESPDIIELRKEFEERFGSTEVFDNFYINLRNRIAKDTMKAMIEGQSKDQDIIDWLKSENAYLRGKIEVYEKFLKDRGFIKEE